MTDGFQVRQLGILNTRSLRKEIKAYLKDQGRNWYLLFFLYYFTHSWYQFRMLGMDVTDDRYRIIAFPGP